MPVFKNQTAVEIARGVKAFLNVEAGIVRDGRARPPLKARGASAKLKRAGGRLAGRARETIQAGARSAGGNGAGGVRPENMVWIFGTGRTGSTWLRSIMGDISGHAVWEEPMVGRLFGDFYEGAQSGQKGSSNFIMGTPTRRGWIRSVRNFTLDGARYAHPRLGPDGYLIIKEPNGSIGAPLLMEALPESRLILLVRDPRDVAASALDAGKKDSWLFSRKDEGGWKQELQAEKNPKAFLKGKASKYLQFVGNSKKAYDAHKGHKVLVRYEELVADTLPEMRRIYSELGMGVEQGELERVVSRHSWENIPEEEKGEGKFYRKGSPGSWREDLTQEQAEVVERVTAPLLEEFYPERG